MNEAQKMTLDQMTAEDYIVDQRYIDDQIYDTLTDLIKYHQRPDQKFQTYQHHFKLREGYMLFVEGHTDSLDAEIKQDEDVIARVSVKQIGMPRSEPFPSGKIDVQYECKVTVHKDTIRFGNLVKVSLETDLADAQLTNEDALPVYKLFRNAIDYAMEELFVLKI